MFQAFMKKLEVVPQMNIVAEQWEIKEKKSKLLFNSSHL